LPKLQAAEDALNTLKEDDIIILKNMLKPPDHVKLVLEAVCVLKKMKPVPVPNPKNPKETVLSYWEASKVIF
jgi:dynein heavy chain